MAWSGWRSSRIGFSRRRRTPSPIAASCPTGADARTAIPRSSRRYGPDVESAMPAWEPSTPRARRRGWLVARAGPRMMVRRPWVALLLAAPGHRRVGHSRAASGRWPPPIRTRSSRSRSYQIRTEQREIGVRVDLEFTNTTPDPSGRFSVFENIRLAVHDEATELAASDDRGRADRQRWVPEDRWRPRPRGDDPAARGSPIPGLRQRRADVRASRRRGSAATPGASVGRDLSRVELRDLGRGPRRHPVRLRDAGRWRSTHRGRRHPRERSDRGSRGVAGARDGGGAGRAHRARGHRPAGGRDRRPRRARLRRR